MMLRSVRIVCSVVLACVCLASSPAAQQTAPAGPPPATPPPQQQPPQPAPPVFRSGIDSVSVDVIVTDKQGRPVTDLTIGDFEVREEGKAQVVDTFRLVQVEEEPVEGSATRDILSFADHAREIAREDNRLLVIFLDDYHTRLGNSFVIRERLAEFVSQLGPQDLVALTTPLRPASALTFSRNHSATASELMRFYGRKYDYRPLHPIEAQYQNELPAVQERLRNRWTIAALRGLCEYMGSLRNGRKTILYVSEGMSNNLPAGARTTGTGAMPAPPVLSGPIGGPPTGSSAAHMELIQSMELVMDLESRVFSVANRTNTSIYTIDPRGLTTFEFGVFDNVAQSVDRTILNQTTEVLRSMAEQTDGRAIVNQNNPLPALQQMMRDGSAYYLLGYTSSSMFRDGKFHEIEVRVKRRDVEVRARKGYWAISAEEVARATSAAARPPVAEDVSQALDVLATAAVSARRQPVSVWMAATRGPAEKALVTFVWEAGSVEGSAAEAVDHLTITAEDGQGATVYTGRLDPDPLSPTPGGQVSFEAPAGAVRVRLEVANAAGRRVESVESTLDVPDFSSTAAQITTPFVFRGRTARDLQQIRVQPSPRPTTGRTFSRAERILLRFSAYGPGGTTPSLTMKVLNKQGSQMAAMPPPTATTGQTFESEFSLSAFPPGDYLIEIAADASGEATKRLVAIRVTG